MIFARAKGELYMKKEPPMNNFMFALMSIEYKIDSFLSPPEKILAETNIKEGCKVVDYGCGPGRYTLPLAKMVGEKGMIYAVDVHPLALKKVNKAAKKKEIKNIKVIFAEDINQIEENSIDVVILYDTLHDIKNKEETLKKIDKLLNAGGFLSFKDHHMKEDEIISLISDNTSLELWQNKDKVLSFKGRLSESPN